MEHLYSSFIHSSHDIERFYEWILATKCICRVNADNILVFSSSTTLRPNPDTIKQAVHHVYVLDLNQPHQPFLVKSHNEIITSLEWDFTGKKILLGDAAGIIEIWAMKEYLLNKWSLLHRAICFLGEKILQAQWFDNGIHVRIQSIKEQPYAYSEKFNVQTSMPTVRQFGSKAAQGIIAISNSGLVWSCALINGGEYMASALTCLGHSRTQIQLVDIAYSHNGELLIATSNGDSQYAINFYRILLKLTNLEKEEPTLLTTCFFHWSFYLHALTSSSGSCPQNITNLCFLSRDQPESVLVTAGDNEQSILEMWNLNEKNVQTHKAFGEMEKNIISKQWAHVNSVRFAQPITSVCVSLNSLWEINCAYSQPITVSLKDGTIHCLNKDALRTLCRQSMNNLTDQVKAVCNKPVTCMQFTWSGLLLIVMDAASQLHVFKMPSAIGCSDSSTFNGLWHTLTLLEHSLISGHDWWDVLVSLKASQLDTLCERLAENFQRQSSPVQQKWLLRFLCIKASLHRCYSAGSAGLNRAGDCYALIMLQSIAHLLRQLLRSRDNQEKEGPAENLSNVIQSKFNEVQMNKIIIHLEHKEFYVETVILQSLQHLNQWVGDLALYLVASLPQQYLNGVRFPGGGLIYDKKAINMLRELLTIIRIWGLLNENCLPSFTKLNENVDVVAILYKLLTRSISQEPDEQLLDECCQLPNNVLIPQMELALRATGVASPALFMNGQSLRFYYFRPASQLRYHIKTSQLEGAIKNNIGRRMDAIRHINLGQVSETDNLNVRTCTRCEAISLIAPLFKSTATRSWDQRWIKNCLCGGFWRSSVSSH